MNPPNLHRIPHAPAPNIVTWHSAFRNCLGAQLFFHGRASYRFKPGKERAIDISWKDRFQSPKIIDGRGASFEKKYAPLIKAVATIEPTCSVSKENGAKHGSNIQLQSSSQVLLPSEAEKLEMEEREKLRRSRISKANKGNVPWNKGRKHSPETLQRIRERTRLAMQDPKVKIKLANIGHAQSKDTRVKIGVGVREGWRRRREKLTVQETCCFEWQNYVADAARKGYVGQEELQWDSYDILDKELRNEWRESVEKRKAMPRPIGSKRAPKSLAQRRKISAAISAMWADPGYRERVCSALSKYHGASAGAERKPRIRRASESQTSDKVRVKKKREPDDAMFDAKLFKKVTVKRRKNTAPMYKDPLASTKLEMIKKIKAQRTEMENKKREAIEKAKLLIAEAERAAEALEVAALSSRLAHASLLETRKLIAEATRSIESIESGEVESQEFSNSTSPNWDGKMNPPGPIVTPHVNNSTVPVEPRVNGIHQPHLTEISEDKFEFDKLTLENIVNGGSAWQSELMESNTLPLHQLNNVKHKDAMASSVGALKVNGMFGSETQLSSKWLERQVKSTQCDIKAVDASLVAKTKKKWVCGRLVEVEED